MGVLWNFRFLGSDTPYWVCSGEKKWWDQLATFIAGFSIEFACRQKQSKSNGDHVTMAYFNIIIRNARIEIIWWWEASKAATSQISHISPCLWTRVCKPRTIKKTKFGSSIIKIKSANHSKALLALWKGLKTCQLVWCSNGDIFGYVAGAVIEGDTTSVLSEP